jgi:hypothetical protein
MASTRTGIFFTIFYPGVTPGNQYFAPIEHGLFSTFTLFHPQQPLYFNLLSSRTGALSFTFSPG